LWAWVAFALLALAVVSLHSHHFSGREYRQDEAWGVHAALEKPTAQQMTMLVAGDIHPPLWYIFGDIWVNLFGQMEPIVRFSSTLLILMSLAFVYRLAADLFDDRVALAAVFFLGTFSAIEFFGHEFRPYAALVLMTIGTQFAFLRWLRRPTFRRGLLFVLFGSATLYTHFFGVYMLGALFVFFILFVRPKRRIYLQGLGLFAAVGLSFVGWILPFLHAVLVTMPSGPGYAIALNESYGIGLLQRQLDMRPGAVGTLLLIVGLFTPLTAFYKLYHLSRPASRRRFWLEPGWRKAYAIGIPALIVFLAFSTSVIVNNVTPRNMIVILPSLAIFAGYALRVLPKPAQAAVVLLVTIPAATEFRAYVANGPFFDVVGFIAQDDQPDSRIVIDAGDSYSHHVSLLYYLRERGPYVKPNDATFDLMPSQTSQILQTFPALPVNLAMNDSSANLQRFEDFLTTEQVWYVSVGHGTEFNDPFLDLLNRGYAPYRSASFGRDRGYPPHNITEYRRIPDELRDIYLLGEDVALQHWTLQNDVDVQPCQTVTLESWWQTAAPLDKNYSMTLVLADSTGVGIARTDSTPALTLTQQWEPNRPYLDIRDLTIPCDIAPGQYPLMVGWYDYDHPAESLPITQPDGAAVGGIGYLTTLTVP
jgi:hypothetical protein